MKAMRGWLAVLSVLAVVGGTWAGDSSGVQTRVVPLGRAGGRAVEALVSAAREPGEPSDVRTIHVRRRVGGAPIGPSLDAGESYLGELRTGAYDFTGANHPQLFVAGKLGRVQTHIYDLSGPKPRVVYSRIGGWIVVTPRRRADGRYDIDEEWPRSQWDEDNLGVGRYNRFSNCIVRRLDWNGTAFVPDYPGKSRIAQ